MNRLLELHHQAMDIADQALIARHRNDQEAFVRLSAQACELESAAAALIAHDLTAEPTRSVLHRSAATLALDCGDTRTAERLIATALSGNPPDAIADELRDVLYCMT